MEPFFLKAYYICWGVFHTFLAGTSGTMSLMKSIQQDYVIEAPVSEVWKALTDGPTAEQWGAAPAKVDAHEGGEFSYWDGDIHGTYTNLSQKSSSNKIGTDMTIRLGSIR